MQGGPNNNNNNNNNNIFYIYTIDVQQRPGRQEFDMFPIKNGLK